MEWDEIKEFPVLFKTNTVDSSGFEPSNRQRRKRARGSATQELLTTHLIILNNSQETRMTSELSPLSPNFLTTPTGGHLSFDRFNVHRPPEWRIFSIIRLKLMTRRSQVRYLDHDATADIERV
ncbi:hypothetical protein TNCV_1804561 [Trichonephila clavipes]|nr:hypothetical protein TNCV_1804561 [Trichonephila clavipes]